MASGLYNRFKYNVMKKLIDLSTDTCKVILLTSSHAFDADHDVLTDVNANELPAAGNYVINGESIGTPTVTQDDVNDCATFDGDNIVWNSATFTARYAVIYDSTVSNSLVGCVDFGSDKSVSAGTFTIQWSGNGIVRLS